MKKLRILIAILFLLFISGTAFAIVENLEIPPKQYTGNGVTTDFPITFDYDSDSDLTVSFVNDSDGSIDAWTQDALGDQGYTIVDDEVIANTAPDDGRLVIDGETPLTQTLNLKNNRATPAELYESALDKGILATRDVKAILDRTMTAPATADPSVDYTAPEYEAGSYWQWDPGLKELRNAVIMTSATSIGTAIGDVVQLIDDGSGNGVFPEATIQPYIDVLETGIDDLEDDLLVDHKIDSAHIVYSNASQVRAATLTPFQNQKMSTTGTISSGDGGGGDWYWDASSTDTDNTGTILKVATITTGRWLRVYTDPVNIIWFGADSEDAIDDIIAIQATIDAADPGSTILIPAGILSSSAYIITDTLTITKALTILGEGIYSVIKQTTPGKGGFYVTSSYVTFDYIRLTGIDYSTQISAERAIVLEGIVSAYLTHNIVKRCYIDNWRFYGIRMDFIENFWIQDNFIEYIYNAGIAGLSVQDGEIENNNISNIVGTPNAYGVILTRNATGDLATYPKSARINVTDNKIYGVDNWEGLDTHAGEDIKFIGNTIRRCKIGINISNDGDENGPVRCHAIGNSIKREGLATDEVTTGIVIAGITDGAAIAEAAGTCIIANNVVSGYGDSSSSSTLTGAVLAFATNSVDIHDNIISNSYGSAIMLYHSNLFMNVHDNIIGLVSDDAGGANFGIRVRTDLVSTTQSGVIQNNVIVNVDTGIRIDVDGADDIKVGPNFINATSSEYISVSGIAVEGLMTYTDGDATPSVRYAKSMSIANTGATDITNLDDGLDGQIIALRFEDSNSTLKQGSFHLEGTIDVTPTVRDVIMFVFLQDKWTQTGPISTN